MDDKCRRTANFPCMHKWHKLTKKHLPPDAAGETVDSGRHRDRNTPSSSIRRSARISISDDGIFYYWRLTRTLPNFWRRTHARMHATITYHRHWRHTMTRQCQTERTCQLVWRTGQSDRQDEGHTMRGVQITNADPPFTDLQLISFFADGQTCDKTQVTNLRIIGG